MNLRTALAAFFLGFWGPFALNLGFSAANAILWAFTGSTVSFAAMTICTGVALFLCGRHTAPKPVVQVGFMATAVADPLDRNVLVATVLMPGWCGTRIMGGDHDGEAWESETEEIAQATHANACRMVAEGDE